MAHDFNDAEKQSAGGLIPNNTIVPVHLTVRPGGAGEDSWLKRSKAGDSLAVDCEFTVLDGPYARRKFWSLLTVEGETEGQKKAMGISRSRLRAMLESARGISPADESEKAKEARKVTSYGDFDGLRFLATVGIEKAKDGYEAKNIFLGAVTPDRKDWEGLEQVGSTNVVKHPAAQAAPAKAAGRPSWA